MPTFLVSYYFATKSNEGWSENHYCQETDIDAAATLAATKIGLRMALSPDNVDMVYAKVSDIAVLGDSKIVQPTGQYFPFVGTHVADPVGAYLEANTALLIEWIAGPAKKNRTFLRGLSLDVVTGREMVADAAYSTALNAWITAMIGFIYVQHADPLTGIVTYTESIDGFFTKVTARKPGRPFVLPRGRKFAHRSHALTAAAKSSTSSVPATQPKSVSRKAPTP